MYFPIDVTIKECYSCMGIMAEETSIQEMVGRDTAGQDVDSQIKNVELLIKEVELGEKRRASKIFSRWAVVVIPPCITIILGGFAAVNQLKANMVLEEDKFEYQMLLKIAEQPTEPSRRALLDFLVQVEAFSPDRQTHIRRFLATKGAQVPQVITESSKIKSSVDVFIANESQRKYGSAIEEQLERKFKISAPGDVILYNPREQESFGEVEIRFGKNVEASEASVVALVVKSVLPSGAPISIPSFVEEVKENKQIQVWLPSSIR